MSVSNFFYSDDGYPYEDYTADIIIRPNSDIGLANIRSAELNSMENTYSIVKNTIFKCKILSLIKY